jgi:amino acid transporter/nucleotide-binding universal stress UspA family protein
MILGRTKRPRNVDGPRAAAILYGDWGTSKAYVIGLAFAIAGYSSFWLILAMSVLLVLVGINYMAICRHYPNGGGVYASVYHRSKIIAIIGAFLLIADYIVTASISALSAFQYIQVPHPEIFAGVAIIGIGTLNYFGPKNTGGLAVAVSVPTVLIVVGLTLFSLPHFGEAWRNVKPLSGGFWHSWSGFVGIVLAVSGVEAIANATGVMKLDRGSTEERPSVKETSTPAILSVVLEVSIFTVLLGLGMNALGGLQIDHGDVNAPGHPGVRDYMLRYMAEAFVGGQAGPIFGQIAAWLVTGVFGFLLLSAVNTAIVDLIAISFLMSRDGELPSRFEKLNGFGVPQFGLIVATVLPAVLVVTVKDIAGLAELYAVGVVGAIATNLGATSTDENLKLAPWERVLMFSTFLIMAAIEVSLLIEKPGARVFAGSVVAVGLVLHGISVVRKRMPSAVPSPELKEVPAEEPHFEFPEGKSYGSPMVCAVRGLGGTLDFAIEIAKDMNRPLYVTFVREQAILTLEDRKRHWTDDLQARKIFDGAREKAAGHPILPCYAVSDFPAHTIVDLAISVGASHLILGAPRRNMLVKLIRGNVILQVSRFLPEKIHLLVYA